MSLLSNSAIGYRRLYALFLRLYPKQYRNRFAEGMEQTYADLCRERSSEQKGLFLFTIGAFMDTAIGILDENISSILSSSTMIQKILKLALGIAAVLLIPLIAKFTVPDFGWSNGDFIAAYVMMFVPSLAFLVISHTAKNNEYKYALALALLGAFLMIWIGGAVGIIGTEDNPANVVFFWVLVTGFLSSCLSMFRPVGMSRAMFLTAAAQVAAPIVAYFIWPPTDGAGAWDPNILGVFGISYFFAAMFLVSAILFKRSAEQK